MPNYMFDADIAPIIKFHNWNAEYDSKCTYLAEHYDEFLCKDFYSYIFPAVYFEGYNDFTVNKPNPILRYTIPGRDGKGHMINRIIFNDYSELDKILNNNFALMGLCTYSGRKPLAANARLCFGLCVDLDYVSDENMLNLLKLMETAVLPAAQFLAVSGSGLHVYYIFDEPIPLYPGVREQLDRLKEGLTMKIWNTETTQLIFKPSDRQYIQHQSIFQAMRAVGSKSKLASKTKLNRPGTRFIIRAFQTNPDKTNLDELNEYVFDSYKIDEEHFQMPQKTPMYLAREKWPKWYRETVASGRPTKEWQQHEGLYFWWRDQLLERAWDGCRYWCVCALFAMAKKTGLPIEVPQTDAMNMLDALNNLTQIAGNEFTEKDIKAASKFYNDKSFHMSNEFFRNYIHYIPEGSIRRNGRTQEEHLKRARLMRENFGSYDSVGRPEKADIVFEWRKKNPSGTKAECVRETGLSRPTVYKWWEQD